MMPCCVALVSQKGSNGDRKLQFFGQDYSSSIMYVLDTKEQSYSQRLKSCSKRVCAYILSERVIKNEPKEIYSIVQKIHKIKPE